MNLRLLLLQIVVILAASRAIGGAFRYLQQPRVVGEMVAGILLGPSFLGWYFAGVYANLFGNADLGPLNALSQIGIVLFMFLIGAELDLAQLHKMGYAVFKVSLVSILAPFLMGLGLAFYFYPKLCDPGVPILNFMLFLGIAMSITAFPVLACIVTERNLLGTRIGTIAMSCAAVDDMVAWCLLAVIVAIVHKERGIAVPVGAVLFLLTMPFIVRPLLRRLLTKQPRNGPISSERLAMLLLFAAISSWTTERIGIHAFFGAFAAGVCLPRSQISIADLRQKLGPLSTVLLLPLFFAYTGLRTHIGLVTGFRMWAYCLAIILVAVAGKFGGAALAAYGNGIDRQSAIAVGILMNTRGLVELVILNIGLDVGVISRNLFSMMVVMALATTAMTTPLLQWIAAKFPEDDKSRFQSQVSRSSRAPESAGAH
jgi:Kef-type K+ transport system membrane component KefB